MGGSGVHWLTTSGYHTASIVPTAGQVQRRIRQYRALTDEATCLRLAKALVHAKIEGQHRYLLRATRGGSDTRQDLLPNLTAIQDALRAVHAAPDRDSLRGQEGQAAVHYFQGVRAVLGPQVPEELRSTTRNRRPPLDRLGAIALRRRSPRDDGLRADFADDGRKSSIYGDRGSCGVGLAAGSPVI